MSERLFVRNKAAWEKATKTNYHIERCPNILELENGIVLPYKEKTGGVCDSNFNFKGGLITNIQNPPGVWGIGSSYVVERSELTFMDETVVFGGVIVSHFGHMMLDCISRLWWHVENPDSNLKFVFVLNKRGWQNWIYDFFDLLGIDRERILIVKEPTQFAKIIVPEESVHSWTGYTDKWECIFALMAKNATARCANEFLPKKIYISKSHYRGGNAFTVNEDYYEEWYRQRGYEVIVPEQLSIYKQIAIAANAEAIATTSGTTSHFNLFSKHNTRIDVILRDDIKPFFAQCLINQMKEADYYFIDGSLNFLPSSLYSGIHLLGITEYWIDFVKQMWGEDLNKDKISPEVLYQYVEEWTKFFCDRPDLLKTHFQYFDRFDCVDILLRLAHVLLGIKLDKSKYDVTSKAQLRKERDEANKEIDRLKGVIAKQQNEMQAVQTMLKGVVERLQSEI